MTEAFRSPPPPPDYPGQAATRQDVTDTVQRIMGEGIAPPTTPPTAPPATPGHGSESDSASTAEMAKDQAGQVADSAKQAGAQVAETVKEQAGQITEEAKGQAKQLLSQAQSELSEQAGATQQRVAQGLHALADELTGMTKNSDQDGPATDLARQAADRARAAAGWLGDRDPGSLLNEVRSFARRKPGTYLAIALSAGVLAGRLTRGLTAPADDTSTTSPAAPDTPAGALGRGPGRFDGTEPVGNGLGAPPTLPPASAPLGGVGATGPLTYPQGEVAP